jgi:hypothetical protein
MAFRGRAWFYTDLAVQNNIERAEWVIPAGIDSLPQRILVERTRISVTAWGPTELTTPWYPNDIGGSNGSAVVYAKYGYRTGPGDDVIEGVWPDLGDLTTAPMGRPVIVSSLVPTVQRLTYTPTDGTPVYSWVIHADSEASDSHAMRSIEDTASGLPLQGALLCVAMSIAGPFGPSVPSLECSAAGWAAVLMSTYD